MKNDGLYCEVIHNDVHLYLASFQRGPCNPIVTRRNPSRSSNASQEERLIHGKLEGLAYQYNTLLASRLDEQRHFYEKQVCLFVRTS